jgi:hypothetical protein
LESMRWLSTFRVRRRWRRDTARGAPVAPVTATMMRLRGGGRARVDWRHDAPDSCALWHWKVKAGCRFNAWFANALGIDVLRGKTNIV